MKQIPNHNIYAIKSEVSVNIKPPVEAVSNFKSTTKNTAMNLICSCVKATDVFSLRLAMV